MIPFDFIYCRPDSLAEAVTVFNEMQTAGHSPLYYGGGSEIITMARTGSIRPGAVIDIKAIPECLALQMDEDKLIIGAANTLNLIKESRLFPLLGTAGGRIADHTNQCRITLGGNLCGTIIYRETSLPLMLSDAEIMIYGPGGMRAAAFGDVFRERMRLMPGEFLTQVHVPAWALHAPCIHIKKTAKGKIDYPLVNVTAMLKEGQLRIAFSGLCAFPFRSTEIEEVLNDRSASHKARADAVPGLLPAPVHSDAEASGGYRLFVLKNTLLSLLEEWDHGSI